MRHGSDQAMPTFGPAVAPCHVGFHRAFINENQLRRGQLGLLLAPFNACLGNILTRLLGRVEGLFLDAFIGFRVGDKLCIFTMLSGTALAAVPADVDIQAAMLSELQLVGS
jgi:hypothetical protein